MITKTIKFTDYNGVQREEEWKFHISRAELSHLELTTTGGLQTLVKRIMNEKDNAAMVKLFEQLIFMSVGKVSDDGRRFVKNDDVLDEFRQSEAYSELLMELFSDADKAVAFVNGIVPQPDQVPNPIPAGK